jgi:AmmeMemoRadiSam system protein A
VPLSPEEGRRLVQLARATIAARLKHPSAGEERHTLDKALQAPVYSQTSGTFVTLKKSGNLRGCIGTLTSAEALRDSVRRNAINAAFQDPRFPPLAPEELDHIVIEVSVLTPPVSMRYSDSEDLVRQLRPGIDGVILRKGPASATFLPQVWKQLPRCQDFLAHLCLKAGLKAQAWREGHMEVETYQVQYFEEGDWVR